MTDSKSKEIELKECLEFLEETRFNFACFVDSFKNYVNKLIKENDRNKSAAD